MQTEQLALCDKISIQNPIPISDLIHFLIGILHFVIS